MISDHIKYIKEKGLYGENRGYPPRTILGKKSFVCRDSNPRKAKVYRWYNGFKPSRGSLENDSSGGWRCPLEASFAENIEKVENFILEDAFRNSDKLRVAVSF